MGGKGFSRPTCGSPNSGPCWPPAPGHSRGCLGIPGVLPVAPSFLPTRPPPLHLHVCLRTSLWTPCCPAPSTLTGPQHTSCVCSWTARGRQAALVVRHRSPGPGRGSERLRLPDSQRGGPPSHSLAPTHPQHCRWQGCPPHTPASRGPSAEFVPDTGTALLAQLCFVTSLSSTTFGSPSAPDLLLPGLLWTSPAAACSWSGSGREPPSNSRRRPLRPSLGMRLQGPVQRGVSGHWQELAVGRHGRRPVHLLWPWSPTENPLI